MPSDGHEYTYNINLRLIGDPRTDEILCLLRTLIQGQRAQGQLIMAIGQDIVDKVAEQTTVIDSLLALVQGLIDNNTIPAAVGAQILSNIKANTDKLSAAIVANTPVDPALP